MITLILARHGETTWNKNGKIQGATDTSTLTKVGKEQATLLAEKLKSFSVEKIYCSELKRAKQTAAIISKALKKRVSYSLELNERSFGEFEGGDVKEVFSKLAAMDDKSRYLFVPKGGESLAQFEKRVYAQFEKIVEENEGKIVLVVTHGGVIRSMINLFKDTPIEHRMDLKIPNTSLTIFKMHEKAIREEIIADTEHLNGMSL